MLHPILNRPDIELRQPVITVIISKAFGANWCRNRIWKHSENHPHDHIIIARFLFDIFGPFLKPYWLFTCPTFLISGEAVMMNSRMDTIKTILITASQVTHGRQLLSCLKWISASIMIGAKPMNVHCGCTSPLEAADQKEQICTDAHSPAKRG